MGWIGWIALGFCGFMVLCMAVIYVSMIVATHEMKHRHDGKL